MSRNNITIHKMKAVILLALGLGTFAYSSLASQFTVTVLSSTSATWPPGTYFQGNDSRIYQSQTATPTGPFTGQSCMFRGWNSGGATESLGGVAVAYRMRLDFDQEVVFNSFREVGCSWQQGSFFRVLTTNGVVLSSNALPVAVLLNVTNSVSLKLRGSSFIIEEYDPSSQWRFRESFVVSFTPVSGVPTSLVVASMAVSWASETNSIYQVEYRSQLTPNSWFPLGTQVTGDGTTKMVFDNVLGMEQRYYRVVRLQ